MVRRVILAAMLAVVSACASSRSPAPGTAPSAPPSGGPPAVEHAPWQQAALRAADVPSVFVTEWRKAENRSTCALIAPAKTVEEAVPRAATFSGGWAVAYDTPTQRSAFGVAGTGSNAGDPSYDAWPHKVRWADGSSAGYGPEGGTGSNQLAYLRITGEGCLYNVWSRLGVMHLETLLSELRFVRAD